MKEQDRRTALLVAACRRDAAASLAPSDVDLLAEPSACDRFIVQAAQQSVLGLTLATLERAHLIDALPAAISATLGEALRGLRRRATILQMERDFVLGQLARSNVPAVVLKGAGLATTVYDEPVEREFGDIDLLIPRANLETAVAALAAQRYLHAGSEHAEEGYREHHFHLRMQRAAGPLIELHWGLTASREPFSLDPLAFLAGAVRGDAVARVPGPVHALMHIVTENARDAFNRLNRIVDVDRIITVYPSLDWSEAIALADASDLRAALALSVALARVLLGTQLPPEIRARLRPPASVRMHLELLEPRRALLEQRALARESWAELLRMWLLPDHTRRGALARMLRADSNDPLQWLWEGGERAEHRGLGLGGRVGHAARTIGFQLEVYGKAIGRGASRLVRRAARQGGERPEEIW
ncbi:MAG: nucleotidyltransferase family protein [Gemmatimonadota bacterium]|nr:nucleotidyltransferase family protein [Gemmatimonadota bacterium]